MISIKDPQTGLNKLITRSKGTVIDNRDPSKRGRIRLKHAMLGETTWIPYLKTHSFFDPPQIGDIVYVETDCGFVNYPVAWGNVTKGTNAAHDLPIEFQRDVPSNRGLKTPKGQLIEFDDGIATPDTSLNGGAYTTANKGIRITSSANNKIHIFEDTDNAKQYILLQDVNGNFIKLDYSNNTLSISSTDVLNLDSQGDQHQRSFGNMGEYVDKQRLLEVTGNNTETLHANDNYSVGGNQVGSVSGNLQLSVTGNITISSNATVTISGNTKVIVSSSDVELGASATEAIIKGNAFKTYFDAHTHPTAVGPSGAPAVPMPTTTLSTVSKTE